MVFNKPLGFVYIGLKAEATSLPDGVHRESNLMLTLNSNNDQTKNPLLGSLSLSVNKPLTINHIIWVKNCITHLVNRQ